MRIKRKSIYTFLSLFFFKICVVGQGNIISISDNSLVIEIGATVYVEGDVIIEDDSFINNKGDLSLTNDWVNNSNGFFATSLSGNVHLIGDTQEIRGTNNTDFYNLFLYGDYSVKECLLNTVINGQLHLNDAELQTNDYKIFITNANPNAVTFNKGYVASDLLGGYLIRKTKSDDEFVFPVGNSMLGYDNQLRPVTIYPLDGLENDYAVRLAPISINNETGISITGAVAPFSSALIKSELSGFNEVFYHNITRINGRSPANIDIWYQENDGIYNTVAHWRNEENWFDENFDIKNVTNPSIFNFPRYKASVLNYNNFTHDAFVLSKVFKAENLFVPNTFTPNGDNDNDIFKPVFSYENIHQFELRIFDRWGNQIFLTNDSTEGWDGLYLNEEAPIGTYVWLLKIKRNENNANYIKQSGHLNLLR